ncbi:hypothetical protein DQ384_36415 [Sphaerisporangium album]|uniref:Uncharacterized protein n=1 Tax=Sphaerisporangium album TaxID=509200 RepID=A0A367EUZ1_9ACTN|nr:hypothetical protein [Sphaerisporangium album]RCG21946.1 hypothetical protein DQ384_36415 [Sphaerisporangium album]
MPLSTDHPQEVFATQSRVAGLRATGTVLGTGELRGVPVVYVRWDGEADRTETVLTSGLRSLEAWWG